MSVRTNFADIYLRGMRDRSMRSGTELAREIQPTDWSTAAEQGKVVFFGFDHAITGAIYFTLHNGKKSSLDRPNYTSIQVFHFKIYVKKKRKKEIRFDKQIFFS